MTVERAARRFVRQMEDLGVGVTITTPGHEPVVLVEPPTEETAVATLERARQLSFDIGGNHPAPGGASLSITGTGHMRSELFMGDDVTVQVVDAAGEIVASYDGACVGIQFKTHEATTTTAEWVERKHVIKLGDSTE